MATESTSTKTTPHHPRKVKRLIIKIGSALLSNERSTDFTKPHHLIDNIAKVIMELRGQGIETVLVTSGAVAIGRIVCTKYQRQVNVNLNKEANSRQVLASLGQSTLMNMYQQSFAAVEMPIAQVLLTARDFRDRAAYLNMGHTLELLSQMNVQPIINENDTIGSKELEFGDNDTMAAACASIFKAQLVIILTESNGFLDQNNERISQIHKVTPVILAAAKGPQGPGSGGMLTKIQAAHLCGLIGSNLAVLPGRDPHSILEFLSGKDIGTHFSLSAKSSRGAQVPNQTKSSRGAQTPASPATRSPADSTADSPADSAPNKMPFRQSILRERKKWLLFSPTRGSLVIDLGATQALMHKGSSILIPGIRRTIGQFSSQEIIEIQDAAGQILGKGIVAYSAKEIQTLMERKESRSPRHADSADSIIGRTVVIHRNNLVLMHNFQTG